MHNQLYYLYRIDSRPGVDGEFLGPYGSEHERDADAIRLRREARAAGRYCCVYRVNIDEELARTVISPSIVAA